MVDKPLLHQSPGSHHCRRVALLIHEMDLDVETEFVDVRPPGMGGQNETAEFLGLNPNAKVPVLQHGSLVLTESNAIMNYLCSLGDQTSFLPDEAETRALVLAWQFWQAAHLSPTADGLMRENMMKPMLGKAPDKAIVIDLLSDFDRWAKVLEHRLQTGQYLVGDSVTCADLSVVSALMYQHAARLPVHDYPAVAAWVMRMQSRPSWKATEPPPMPMES